MHDQVSSWWHVSSSLLGVPSSHHTSELDVVWISTLCLPRPSCTAVDLNSALRSSAADINVDALSGSTIRGKDFLLKNWRKAGRNISSDRSVTTSKRTALVLAHVNKHIYTLFSLLVLECIRLHKVYASHCKWFHHLHTVPWKCWLIGRLVVVSVQLVVNNTMP